MNCKGHTHKRAAPKVAPLILLHGHEVSDWYGSRGRTFSIARNMLPWDRWQQRCSLTKWWLISKCIWSKALEFNSSMLKKWQPVTFINSCQCLWRPNTGCEHSNYGYCTTVTLKTRHILDSSAYVHKHSIQALVSHWQKSIMSGGDYVGQVYFAAENLL